MPTASWTVIKMKSKKEYCYLCSGTGKLNNKKCPACAGSGYENK